MRLRYPVLAAIALLASLSSEAKTFMTQQQALDSAFGRDAKLQRQSIFLTEDERKAAKAASGVEFDDELVVRYEAKNGSALAGWVYFDAHRVRTLPETLMVVVRPDGTVDRIEILSFSEPEDYLPKRRWLDQLSGKKLDDDLSVKRSIRPISGATLSGRAIVNASRKILAIHGTIEGRSRKKGSTAK